MDSNTPAKPSMKMFRDGTWSDVVGQGKDQPLQWLKQENSLFITTELGKKDWLDLAKPRTALHIRANDENNLAFELSFMDVYRHRMRPPTRMQVDLTLQYSLDRADLGIRTSENKPHQGDHSWQQLRFGFDMTKSEDNGQLYGQIYITTAGMRMLAAIETLKSALEINHTKHLSPNLLIATFLFDAIWIAIDQFALCLDKNAAFLWLLAQKFADEAKPSDLGFAKEFYQMSVRTVGLERRLRALSGALDLVKGNKLVKACVAADSSGNLQARQKEIDDRLSYSEPMLKYINTSFQQLLPMVVDVTSSKRADAANDLAASGRVIAFAALAYSPASIAVGLFGMELDFIKQSREQGYRPFFVALVCCYIPVFVWLLYSFGSKLVLHKPSHTLHAPGPMS